MNTIEQIVRYFKLRPPLVAALLQAAFAVALHYGVDVPNETKAIIIGLLVASGVPLTMSKTTSNLHLMEESERDES